MACTVLGIKFKNMASEIKLTDMLGSMSLSTVMHTTTNNSGSSPPSGTSPPTMSFMTPIPEVDSCSESSCSTHSTDTEYYMYSRVETHMHISMSLYFLNNEGCNILRQLDNTKHIVGSHKKQKLDQDVPMLLLISVIVSTLKWLVSEKRLEYNIYSELLNTLDGELFEECKDIDVFLVRDEEFTLESMYYRQETWVTELDDRPCHVFEFDTDPMALTLGECSYLLLYFKKYTALIDMIKASFEGKEKVHKLGTKMRERLNVCISLLQEQLDCLLAQDNE